MRRKKRKPAKKVKKYLRIPNKIMVVLGAKMSLLQNAILELHQTCLAIEAVLDEDFYA